MTKPYTETYQAQRTKFYRAPHQGHEGRIIRRRVRAGTGRYEITAHGRP